MVKSRPGSTQEMVDLGNILKMKTLQRHFARPKSRPLIVFYQASSVPMVNQAVISLIRGCKAIGMCMNQQICILDCLYPKIHCSRRNKKEMLAISLSTFDASHGPRLEA